MESLRERLLRVPQTGRVEALLLRPARGTPAVRVQEAALLEARGVEGDYVAQGEGGPRQITLIQAEHLPVIAALVGRAEVSAEQLRRNVVVSGINLHALRTLRFTLGEALLEGTGHCAPCAKMELVLGPGGFQALRGHGGITARVLRGGRVRVGDPVRAASC